MHGFHPRDSKEESRQWRSDKMMEGERKKSGGQESKWWRQEKKTASLVRSNWLRCYKANKVITFSLCRTRASQTQAAVLNTYLSPDLNATKTCVIYLPPMNLYPSRSMIRYRVKAQVNSSDWQERNEAVTLIGSGMTNSQYESHSQWWLSLSINTCKHQACTCTSCSIQCVFIGGALFPMTHCHIPVGQSG